MNLGIVTIVDNTNYGNRLQNYAVSYLLNNKLKHKAVTLTTKEERSFYNGRYIPWLKDQIAKRCCILPKFAEKKWGNGITRWANFHNWTDKYIPTKIFYGTKSLPEIISKEYNTFFTGSDQVWNYNFSSHKFDDYFLRFADDVKKNSISASMGVDSLPEEWKESYKKDLNSFANISVREDAGAQIIKELTGMEVPVLIDPTMMLSKEEWLKVSVKPRVDCTKPYILKYYLGDEAEEEKIDMWAKENGYEVYELMNDKIPELYSAGPGEFISLISNASLVCSDSFHCIVFSIIFSKPFIVYARRGTGNYMTSRLHTLLKKFNFENRWKHMLSKDEYLDCDFSHTAGLMKKEQQQFMDYISKILEQAKDY